MLTPSYFILGRIGKTPEGLNPLMADGRYYDETVKRGNEIKANLPLNRKRIYREH